MTLTCTDLAATEGPNPKNFRRTSDGIGSSIDGVMNQSSRPIDPEQSVSLPVNRSFVLQFRAGSGVDPGGSCSGRVEHVVSGEATRFEDRAALCEFIARILRTRTSGSSPAENEEEAR
ncbi:hypothetical protein [Leekyejoonella antrihumi]|uniref:Uncharacterized protein n=1 Tax=Leekyejoonella antrihumi TaxID=1660198 RepID=A0A563E0I4_9MICO|nr:hypothetical protein [Leekyejoonella antrihumi]TWP35733.1 hypothetical protein FGL98_13060 [Leekyejoonella antrihumi]